MRWWEKIENLLIWNCLESAHSDSYKVTLSCVVWCKTRLSDLGQKQPLQSIVPMIINRVSSWDSNLYFIFIFEAGKVSGSIIQYLQNNLLVRHIQVNFELGDPLRCTNADLISERQMDPFSAQLIRFLVLSWDIPEFEFLTSPSIPNHLRELISFLPQRS